MYKYKPQVLPIRFLNLRVLQHMEGEVRFFGIRINTKGNTKGNTKEELKFSLIHPFHSLFVNRYPTSNPKVLGLEACNLYPRSQ